MSRKFDARCPSCEEVQQIDMPDRIDPGDEGDIICASCGHEGKWYAPDVMQWYYQRETINALVEWGVEHQNHLVTGFMSRSHFLNGRDKSATPYPSEYIESHIKRGDALFAAARTYLEENDSADYQAMFASLFEYQQLCNALRDAQLYACELLVASQPWITMPEACKADCCDDDPIVIEVDQ